MAMFISENQANQNFYMGVASEFDTWKESFDFSAVGENDIVFFLELDTKVIRYNRSDNGIRSWAVFGADEQSSDAEVVSDEEVVSEQEGDAT